jgi:hypothetical protein
MKQRILLGFVILLLVACTPSAQAIQTAISQTQSAVPTTTLQPTKTPLPDINSVLLKNRFILTYSGYTNAKAYEYIDSSSSFNITAIILLVFDNGMFSITMYEIDGATKTKIYNVVQAIYGSVVSNWITSIIQDRTFSQPLERNGSIDGYNIEISIFEQEMHIRIMPESP